MHIPDMPGTGQTVYGGAVGRWYSSTESRSTSVCNANTTTTAATEIFLSSDSSCGNDMIDGVENHRESII